MQSKENHQQNTKDNLWNGRKYLQWHDQHGINIQNIYTTQYQENNLIKNGQKVFTLFFLSTEKNRNLRVCHTLADTNKPVMAPGSPESHLTPDDKDSKDQTVVIKPVPLPTLIIAPDGEFHPNSRDTGKVYGTNWFMGVAANIKFVS